MVFCLNFIAKLFSNEKRKFCDEYFSLLTVRFSVVKYLMALDLDTTCAIGVHVMYESPKEKDNRQADLFDGRIR